MPTPTDSRFRTAEAALRQLDRDLAERSRGATGEVHALIAYMRFRLTTIASGLTPPHEKHAFTPAGARRLSHEMN